MQGWATVKACKSMILTQTEISPQMGGLATLAHSSLRRSDHNPDAEGYRASH
jgi:hypothetical protein